jgi:deoxyribonuclease V
MIAAVDAHYDVEGAVGASVLFRDWSDADHRGVHVSRVEGAAAAYVPGELYRRELPVVLRALEPYVAEVRAVVIDGYVWLAPERPGLGVHLWDALDRRVAIVGVAKTLFRSARDAVPVLRAASRRPLYVTSVGLPTADAAAGIARMHGAHRIPTMLALADRLARDGAT